MRFPAPLRPGDRIAAFAGSSPFDRTLVWRGLAWLRERYDVVFDRAMFERTGYLAGSDERRLGELRRFLEDDSVKAIVAARGGYGLNRIAHLVDWERFSRHPKWIVGFSDVTVLHAEAQRAGVASLHGPNVAGVGRSDRWSRERFVRALEDPSGSSHFETLEVIAPGVAEGPLLGGNLAMIHAQIVSGRMPSLDGAVVLLEDVTERPYRVDRMLSTLLVGNHFGRAAGFLIGEWTDCSPGPDGVRVDHVVRERLGSLGVPVLSGAPVGHGRFNAPVVLGRRYRLDSSSRSAVAIAEPQVENCGASG